jgi:alkylation response protein AidB-like acyl-CoA dehydrogenase
MCGGVGLCEVFFDNARVPRENIVGVKDDGWRMALSLLNFERGLDAGTVGMLRGFYDLMLAYLKAHNLTDRRWVQEDLADYFIDMETARLFAYKVVWLASKGLHAGTLASMSKVFCSEAEQRCSHTMMKIINSYGLLEDGHDDSPLLGRIAHWYFGSFSCTLARGTSEVQRNILATRDLGLPRDR